MTTKTLALLLLGLAVPAVCSAQSVKAGLWTGSVTPPEGGETMVTFDVTVHGDSLGIVIHAGEHGDFTAENGKFADGKISFVFHPGPRVACNLTRNEEGVFAGPCLDEEGSEARITMVPPKE